MINWVYTFEVIFPDGTSETFNRKESHLIDVLLKEYNLDNRIVNEFMPYLHARFTITQERKCANES